MYLILTIDVLGPSAELFLLVTLANFDLLELVDATLQICYFLHDCRDQLFVGGFGVPGFLHLCGMVCHIDRGIFLVLFRRTEQLGVVGHEPYFHMFLNIYYIGLILSLAISECIFQPFILCHFCLLNFSLSNNSTFSNTKIWKAFCGANLTFTSI